MSNGSIKHIFPGGNTSQGFYSYYDNVLKQEKANKMFILKGGPGVGKSTYMKKIGQMMLDKGYDIEFLHCSSDNESLDGVSIPQAGIALIDGTAPHVVDPRNPGAVDEIINLGDFWDEEGIKKNKDFILKCGKDIKKSFERAYRYLKSAKCLFDDIEEINILALREEKAKNLTLSLIDEIFSGKERHNNKSNERCLFASAITPDGLINYIPSLLNNIEKVYVIKCECAMPVDQVLERLRREAWEMGYDVELFYCAFNPKKLEHVIIPGISTAVLTSNEFHSVNVDTCKEIDFRKYENISIHKMYEDTLNFDNAEFNSLLNQAVKTISQAKKIHDRLEEFYIPHMNFEEMQKNYNDTVQKILKCIGK